MFSLLLFLLIGALASFLAGKIMRGRDFGLGKNMLLGMAGAFVGGFLFRLLGFHTFGLPADLLVATVGAIVILWLAGRRR